MTPHSQSQTLLARIQATDGQGERPIKRVKKGLSLLDRLQAFSPSSSPTPAPSPSSDIRIKNASGSGSTQSLLEPLRRTSIEEKSEVPQMGRRQPSSAAAEHSAKSAAFPATLSIRGAANKSNGLLNTSVVAEEPCSTRRPSLLERTFPSPANQARTIEQSASPKPRPFRERLAARSLKDRLLMTERAGAAGDDSSSGRRKRGGNR